MENVHANDFFLITNAMRQRQCFDNAVTMSKKKSSMAMEINNLNGK